MPRSSNSEGIDGSPPVQPPAHDEQPLLEPSEQARLRHDATKFRVLCESSPLGIFECDRQGQVTYFNRHMADLVGLGSDESFRDAWTRAVHPR